MLPDPTRVKFFSRTMMAIPEVPREQEEEHADEEEEPGGGGEAASRPRATGGARDVRPKPKPSGTRGNKATEKQHGTISSTRNMELMRLLARLQADADDVANLRDVADVD